MQRRPDHIPGLDGLRAIAIIGVIICHVAILLPPPGVTGPILASGWLGVDLFFVLSGFLITRILRASRSGSNYFRNFYARRALRIFPLFYLYAMLALFILPRIASLFHGKPWFIAQVPGNAQRASVLLYFFNIWDAVGTGNHLYALEHLWSLCIEEQFYLVWPFVIYLLSRRAAMTAAIVACALSAVCRMVLMHSGHTLASYELTISRADGLFIGSWVAMASEDDRLWQRIVRAAPAVVIFCLVAIVVLAIAAYPETKSMGASPLQGLPITLFCIIFGVVVARIYAGQFGILEHRAMRAIGKYSYGIYVYHMLIAAAVASPIRYFVHMRNAIVTLLTAAAVLGLSFCVASLSFRYFESPFLSMKKRFADPGRPSPQTVEEIVGTATVTRE